MNPLKPLARIIASIPMVRRAIVALRHEPPAATAGATISSVMAAVRAAEAGDTRQLFAIYRDLTISGSHVQAEFNKRKLAVLGEPHSILPNDKANKDDVDAAQAVRQMITGCDNWIKGIGHLMDSTLWPVAVAEKIYRPAPPVVGGGKIALRYELARLEPVNHTLLCFQQPYLGSGVPGLGSGASVVPQTPDAISQTPFEPDVRFYLTNEYGVVNNSWAASYPAEEARHVFHRGHLIGARDCWGGPMRAVVFWWLLGTLARDWWGRSTERFGSPFLVGKTDAQNQESVNLLREAFSLSSKLGGIVVDSDTAIEMEQLFNSASSDAHEHFLACCNREISKVIVGQTLSSEASYTGLGSGVSKLQGQVRDDIRVFDQLLLGETLRQHVFKQFLAINGLPGEPPRIIWGSISAEEIKGLGEVLLNLSQSGLEPTDDAIPIISERVGFQLQRRVGGASQQGLQSPGAEMLKLLAFSAGVPRLGHPSDDIARRKAKALAEAYRGALAPVRAIILNSATPEEARARLAAFYADWKPEKVIAVTEEALQLCAAAGASAR